MAEILAGYSADMTYSNAIALMSSLESELRSNGQDDLADRAAAVRDQLQAQVDTLFIAGWMDLRNEDAAAVKVYVDFFQQHNMTSTAGVHMGDLQPGIVVRVAEDLDAIGLGSGWGRNMGLIGLAFAAWIAWLIFGRR